MVYSVIGACTFRPKTEASLRERNTHAKEDETEASDEDADEGGNALMCNDELLNGN